MTTKPNEPDALEPMPCPFCAASFRHVSDKDGEFWMHPGVVTDDDCFMSGQGIFPRQLSAWNRRAHANPIADAGGVTDADREAAAKCVEHGLSRPNPLNVRQGVVDSWHLVQAFARHRLQSVAAATAAKDAEIADLKHSLMLATAFGQEEAAAHSEADREIAWIMKAINSRRGIYMDKMESSDPLADDDRNRRECFAHTAEAFDILLAEIANPEAREAETPS